MAKVLVDTGPLVSWLDRGDGDHTRCIAFFAIYEGQLVTTWPVLTEVCHLLPRLVAGCFMRWVAADDIAVLLRKYDDLPMVLACASLVWLAEQVGIGEGITLDDTDFDISRLPTGATFDASSDAVAWPAPPTNLQHPRSAAGSGTSCQGWQAVADHRRSGGLLCGVGIDD